MASKRPGSGPTVPQQAAKFLGVSVLSGAVLAGLALPGAGLAGLAAKGSVESFDEIPTDLKRPPLSQRTTILDADGEEIAKVYSRDRTVVDLDQISPHMRKAIVAIEDSRFYEHGAIDLKGILRALNQNRQSSEVQGASTLTQQYVKNVFVEEAGNDQEEIAEATQRTGPEGVGRKIRELKYAIQVEEELGKKQILENYLNITFFGRQAYGVEAAAQRYFSTSAKELSIAQSALLAGLVQSPSAYDPVSSPETAEKRRNVVLNRMAELGDISKKEAKEAKEEPLGLQVSQPKNGCITAVDGASFFCDYVREVFLTNKAFGKSRKERAKRWDRGGMTIKTTLDPTAQASVQASLEKHVRSSDQVAAATSIVEPGTGKILAMGQSRPYGYGEDETEINLSVKRSMGGGSGYQPGSTFKPVVAAAALEQGTSPYKKYSAPYKMEYPSPVSKCGGEQWTGGGSTVENENETEKGPYRMKEATALSVNTYYVQLISDIGICPVSKLSERMGLERADGKQLQQVPSMTLGVQEMTPLTMAEAYATFANNGVHCTPIAIESITDARGKSLKVPESTCKRAMSEKTAHTVNSLLKGVVEDGTGKKAGLSGRDSAGKTGTSDERYAAWFVGYTPEASSAVWVGDPAHERRMVDITIGGKYHEKVFGGGVPGPIWRDAMNGALADKPASKLPTVEVKDKDKGGKKDEDKGDDDAEDDQPDDPKPPRVPEVPELPEAPENPLPDITLPPGMIGGGGNGGNGGGNGGWPQPR
ncbi:transglycosylase domain-containing protein [Streptomyces oceani]|uniref:Penicillin-binding protein n=1 Tax=Streptomyces oceani TaxID=1075402 RepID=A0A1E7JW53_9ACTN|nr:transglycosylase domain-containing protein [Streptomyces oceani]OEU95512.1 penicillin-binding protein [Streptomyces oceani]